MLECRLQALRVCAKMFSIVVSRPRRDLGEPVETRAQRPLSHHAIDS